MFINLPNLDYKSPIKPFISQFYKIKGWFLRFKLNNSRLTLNFFINVRLDASENIYLHPKFL